MSLRLTAARLSFLSLSVLPAMLPRATADTLHVPGDHRTIQAAITAATDGDTVLVSAGTYRETLRLKTGVTVRSDGDQTRGEQGLLRAERTILDGENSDRAPGVIMAERATLDGFTVTRVGRYDDARWQADHATQGNNQSHEHIGHAPTPGIAAIGVSCTVRHCIVHHNGSTGIAIQGVAGRPCSPLIEENVCFRNMGGGIGSMNKSTAVITRNVCFENYYAGIGHDNASPVVTDNECYANIRAGIGISEGACPIVRNNRCHHNRRAGIGTRTGPTTRPVIEGNDCYENDMAGIGSEEESQPLIRGNRCYRNKLAGIGSRTGATVTIVDNECFENAKAGIAQESDAVTVIVGNTVRKNRMAGLGFAPCKKGRSTVLNNRVVDNATVAVGINTGWIVQLEGNELAREGGMPPIVMVFNGATATFRGNTLRGGGVAGIRVGGSIRASNNVFHGTGLRRAGPPNFAIWALPGSSIGMNANQIRGWRHALHASQAKVVAVNNTIHDFHSAALVIQQATEAVTVYGNTAISTAAGSQAVSLTGSSGLNDRNRVVAESP